VERNRAFLLANSGRHFAHVEWSGKARIGHLGPTVELDVGLNVGTNVAVP
jgi:hypothetical protein